MGGSATVAACPPPSTNPPDPPTPPSHSTTHKHLPYSPIPPRILKVTSELGFPTTSHLLLSPCIIKHCPFPLALVPKPKFTSLEIFRNATNEPTRPKQTDQKGDPGKFMCVCLNLQVVKGDKRAARRAGRLNHGCLKIDKIHWAR